MIKEVKTYFFLGDSDIKQYGSPELLIVSISIVSRRNIVIEPTS